MVGAAVVIVPLPIATRLIVSVSVALTLFRLARTIPSFGGNSREPHSPGHYPRRPVIVTGLVRRRGAGAPAADRSVYLQCAIGFVAVTSVPVMPMFDEYGILFAMRMIVATADSPHFSGSRKSAPT